MSNYNETEMLDAINDLILECTALNTAAKLLSVKAFIEEDVIVAAAQAVATMKVTRGLSTTNPGTQRLQ